MSLVVVAMLGVLLVGAALAWACTPQATITLDTSSGPAGTSVTVSAADFIDGPVEIRWSGASGAVLATGQGPAFATTVTIPDAAPGMYYIYGTSTDEEGRRVGNTSRAFQIAGAESPEPSGDSPSTDEGAPAASPAPAAPAPVAPTQVAPAPEAPAEAQTPQPTTAPSDGTAAPESSPAPEDAASPEPAPARPEERDESRGQARSPAEGPASDNPAVVVTGGGERVFGGSVGSTTEEPTSAGAVFTAAGSSEQSERSATTGERPGSGGEGGRADRERSATAGGDRGSESTSSTAASLAPSLSDADVPTDGPGSLLAVGVGLLGVGLATMLGGFLVADVRRRRLAPAALERR
jgi:outer membrane biosynthesis protein TonB